ncbi:M56 family metallopeptidase [Isosphaeraceae bacterium EP7]
MRLEFALAVSFTPLLVDAALRATILLLLANLVIVFARRSSAALRHRIWAFTLAGLVALPVVTWSVPGWNLPAIPAFSFAPEPLRVETDEPTREETTIRADDRPPIRDDRPLIMDAMEARPEPATSPQFARTEGPAAIDPPPSWTRASVVLALWAVGAMASAIPTLLGLTANFQRRRRSSVVRDQSWISLLDDLRRASGIRRPVDLRQSGDSPIALTWGVFLPVILLPAEATNWSSEARRLVLRHELAHIRRLDVAWQLIGRLTTSLFWFHPLAWHALHRMRLECEHACDDCVVQAGERPTDYARQLLALARPLALARSAALVAMARPNTLEQRMNVMFDGTRSHVPMSRARATRLAIVATLLILGLATARPPGAASAADETRAADEPAAAKAQPASPAIPAHLPAVGRIRGRVVKEAGGDPVPGAEVLLIRQYRDEERYRPGGGSALRQVADARGNFAFDGLTLGRYCVWATLGQLTSRTLAGQDGVVELTAIGQSGGPLEILVRPAASLKVRVKDKATGQPIQGANVIVGWADRPEAPITDRDGTYLVQRLMPGSNEVSISADGHANERRKVTLIADEVTNLDVLLGPASTLEGQIRDAEGNPLPGAKITAITPDDSYEFSRAVSDTDGRYRLEKLPIGVAFVVRHGKRAYATNVTPITLASLRQTLDVSLTPPPDGGAIAGTVVSKDGLPIEGALVRNRGDAGVRNAKTGADGRFLMKNLYQDRNFGKEIVVSAKGFAPRRLSVQAGPPDKPAEVSVTLDPGHRIRGRVVDDALQPIAKVRVAFEHDLLGTFDGVSTMTDESGRFSLDSLSAGGVFSFYGMELSFLEKHSLPLDTDEVVTVRLKPAGEISGRVVDSKTDQPIRAFNVLLSFSPDWKSGDPSVRLHTHNVGLGEPCRSDQGQFKISHLFLGMPLQVTVSADGYQRRIVPRVVATDPRVKSTTTFRLDPIDPANLRSYGGRILDSAGLPVSGVQLRLIASGKRDARRPARPPIKWEHLVDDLLNFNPEIELFLKGVTDDAGRFRFDGVPEQAEVELAWWRTGLGRGRSTHLERINDEGKQAIEVTMPATGRLVGRVDRGVFPEAARVEMVRDDLGGAVLELQPGQTDFEFGDLAPGEYGVALLPLYERERDVPKLSLEKVTVKPGEAARVEFNAKK